MGLQIIGADGFVMVVDAVFQRVDRVCADEMTDIVQQGRRHQAVAGAVGRGAGGALFHVLRHAHRFTHVFARSLCGEQVEDEFDNALRICCVVAVHLRARHGDEMQRDCEIESAASKSKKSGRRVNIEGSRVYSAFADWRGRAMGKEMLDFDITETGHSDEVIVALRTVQQSQGRLNQMADQKAHINIGFSLLFITLSQSPALLESVTHSLIRWGFIAVILAVAVSMILALMVVFPRTGGERIQQPEQMINPFYFGMFAQLDQDTYVDYMLQNLHQDQQARRMLLVDIHQIGQVLKRKYRLLRMSYGFLALSVITSAGLFALQSLARMSY